MFLFIESLRKIIRVARSSAVKLFRQFIEIVRNYSVLYI